MDEELKQALKALDDKLTSGFTETTRRFAETDKRIEALDAKHDETRRHFDVVAERLESKIATVAEGVAACNERIDQKFDDLSATMEREFNDVRSMIKFSHHELDRRVRMLEDTVSDLQTRVERLESSTH